MMHSKRYRFLLCLCTAVSLLLSAVFPVTAEDTAAPSPEQIISDILVHHCGTSSVQAWIDTSLTQQAGRTAEWYILALRQHGAYTFDSYETALLSYLSETTTAAASTRQKYALALMAADSTDACISATADETIGQQGIMSWIFGLHLLSNGAESALYSAQSVKETILSLQLSDGGWAVTGTVSDADVTAMALQALAPYYGTDPAVNASVDRALTLLSERQMPTGDYTSYGVENCESTAQVLTALSSLGIDALRDPRFIKDGTTLLDGILRYRLSDGTFCHEMNGAYNETATAQTFFAYLSYQRCLNGHGPIYLLDESDVSDQPILTTTAESASEHTAQTNPKRGSYKLWACLIVIVLGAGLCAVLHLRSRKSKHNCILILILTAVIVGVICLTDIQTKEEYYANQTASAPSTGTVTLTIRCDTIIGREASADIPTDGVILADSVFEIHAESTVYDVLAAATQKNSIQLDTSGGVGAEYVRGLGNLYEFDYGALSGWIYRVNGEQPSVSCSDYLLTDGDKIEWLYSCELGEDLK